MFGNNTSGELLYASIPLPITAQGGGNEAHVSSSGVQKVGDADIVVIGGDFSSPPVDGDVGSSGASGDSIS